MRIVTLSPALLLAACASTGSLPPAEVIRYHLPAGVERGPVAVQPASTNIASPAFEAAVARQLAANGYPAAASGGPAPYLAVVDVRQRDVAGPRRSSFSIGLGGGTFSGGRGGGVGLGGGVGIPIGGGASQLVETELSVLIKRRADQTTVWEGHARGLADPRRRGATEQGDADKLAAALFAGFPGESGRTISVP